MTADLTLPLVKLLAQARNDARDRRDFAQADRIRADLAALGVRLTDRAGVTEVELPPAGPRADELAEARETIALLRWMLRDANATKDRVVKDACTTLTALYAADPAAARSLSFLARNERARAS